jgi:hypothetical protein
LNEESDARRMGSHTDCLAVLVWIERRDRE